jgi:hypothetical protein
MRWLVGIAFACGLAGQAYAEIPYIMTNGYEQVDYAALNPIEIFVLPDSGQFR